MEHNRVSPAPSTVKVDILAVASPGVGERNTGRTNDPAAAAAGSPGVVARRLAEKAAMKVIENRVILVMLGMLAAIFAGLLGYWNFEMGTNGEKRFMRLQFDSAAIGAHSAIVEAWKASLLHLQLGLLNPLLMNNCTLSRSQFKELTNPGKTLCDFEPAWSQAMLHWLFISSYIS